MAYITIGSTTPVVIEKNTFSNRTNATLYVPVGSKAAYEYSDYWKEFKEIVEMEEAKVVLSKTKATMEKGKSGTLKATVYPETLADKSVTWKSSNTKIATVSSAGKVKAVKTGTVTITCTSVATGAKATCEITVGKVNLDKSEASILKGKTLKLTPSVYPATLEDKSVTWESSNPKVATVTSEGKGCQDRYSDYHLYLQGYGPEYHL